MRAVPGRTPEVVLEALKRGWEEQVALLEHTCFGLHDIDRDIDILI